MSAYTIAWLVIVSAALAGAGVLYWMLRNYSKPLIRNIIIGVLLAFFVVPAPLPAYPEQIAPAFVVLIFESLLQIDGSPGVSLRILLLAMALAAGLVAAGHYLVSRRKAAADGG